MACNSNTNCLDKFGCPSDVCPDFVIKRHDTKPPLEIIIKDCGEPVDLTDTVVEVSMWLRAKFKAAVPSTQNYFSLADDIGFEQVNIGDIVVVDRVRSPEQMLVTAFDETNKLIEVQRAYNGTTADNYKKGQKVRIFRFLNAVGETQMTLQDVTQEDGSVLEDVLTESKLIYEWAAADTCLPGCYYLEFKLLKMLGTAVPFLGPLSLAPSIIPSFISYSPSQIACDLGAGVEWVRRYPEDREGFLIQIIDSPTSENLI